MRKDILALGDIPKPAIIEKLLQALAFQVGSEVSVSELSRTLQIDDKTVERNIELLEKCYITFGGQRSSKSLK